MCLCVWQFFIISSGDFQASFIKEVATFCPTHQIVYYIYIRLYFGAEGGGQRGRGRIWEEEEEENE